MKVALLLTVMSLLVISGNSYGLVAVKEVMANSSIELDLYKESDSIVFLFGENCLYCRQQVSEFDCLRKKGINYKIIFMVKDEKDAHREKIKLKINHKVYITNEAFESELMKLGLKLLKTPTLIHSLGSNPRPVSGQMSCKEIVKICKIKS